MIWLLVLRPKFYQAIAHDAREAVATTVLGPRCAVTGERTYPRDRADHEHDQHYGEGACA